MKKRGCEERERERELEGEGERGRERSSRDGHKKRRKDLCCCSKP